MTRKVNEAAVALVREVAEALAAHGDVRCRPEVDEEDGLWTLRVTFRAGDDPARSLEILELADLLGRVRDVAQIRGFAAQYELDTEKLDALVGSRLARLDPQRQAPAITGAGDDRVREIAVEVAAAFQAQRLGLTELDMRPIVRYVLEALEQRETFSLALDEPEREALGMLIADGCALGGPVRMDLRPTLLGIRERLLTDEQRQARRAT